MSAAHALPAHITEETREFVLPTGLTKTRWVAAADLLPSAPSIVRDATIQIEDGPVLALWSSGDDVVPAPEGAAFKLDAGAKVRLKIHYKKNYGDGDRVVEDRSQLGLYFAKSDPSGGGIQTLELRTDSNSAKPGPQRLIATVNGATRVVALRPLLDQSYQSIAVDAVLPTGRIPLLRLRAARAGWPRRYWLSEPVELPAGSQIDAIASPAPLRSDGELSVLAPKLQLGIDFISQ
jgi:hypothetical protein